MKNKPKNGWNGDLAERAAGLSEEEKRLLQELEENEKALWEILFEGLWDALPKHEDLLNEMDSHSEAEAFADDVRFATAYMADVMNRKENI